MLDEDGVGEGRLSDQIVSRWRERHREQGSEPDRFSTDFASIETSLVFDWALRRSEYSAGASVRKYAACLASTLRRKGARPWLEPSNISLWGLVPDPADDEERRGRQEVLWQDRWNAALVEAKLLRLDRYEPYLLLVPVRSNFKTKNPADRTTDTLAEYKVPTTEIPGAYFRDGVVGALDAGEFLMLVVVHALTDVGAWGGCDPYHLRVENGRLHVSSALSEVLDWDAEQVMASLLKMEEMGLIRFAPSRLNVIELPSAEPTFEWLGYDERPDAAVFVVCPSRLHEKSERPQPAGRGARDEPIEVQVQRHSVESPVTLALEVVDVYDLLQYRWGVAVVSDRIAQSVKSQIAKASRDAQLKDVRIQLSMSTGDTDLPLSLVHAAKTVIDGLVRSRSIGDDSIHVLRGLTLKRKNLDKQGRPNVDVKIADANGEQVFHRRYYLIPYSWRPPARRQAPSVMHQQIDTYEEYVAAIRAAVADLPLDGVAEAASTSCRLRVSIVNPDTRVDIDNTALFACDLLTALLNRVGISTPVDALVDEVVVDIETVSQYEPSVYIQLESLT